MEKIEITTVTPRELADDLAANRAYLRQLHQYLYRKAELERRKVTLSKLKAKGEPTDRLEKLIEHMAARLKLLRRELRSAK